MTIYIFINILSLILGYICQKKDIEKFYIFIMIIIFTIISTLRFAIGFDYFAYENIFNNISSSNLEKGFLIFSSSIYKIFKGNYRIFLLISSSIINSITLIWIYKFSKYKWISIYLYTSFQFFAYSMNLIRQSMALSIFLISYKYLIERNFFKYIFFVIFASTFHKSVLIMIPFYFIFNIKITKKYIFLITTFFVILYINFDNLIYTFSEFLEYSKYFNSIYWQANSIKYIILPSIYLIIILLNTKKLIFLNAKNNILINTCIYNFFINLFITKHFIIERLSIYFFIFSLILIPEILDTNKVKKIIITLIIITIGGGYLLFATNEGFHNVYPYRSIFDKSKSY